MGNQNLKDRKIIMTKYFWWLCLKRLHNIKDDPFELALQLEQSLNFSLAAYRVRHTTFLSS